MLVVIRGAGDIASGVIYKLYKAGFRILALEVENPSSIRRTVSFSEAIYKNEQTIEGITAKRVFNIFEIEKSWEEYKVPVLVDPKGEILKKIKADILVDAILAKKNLGTKKEMAKLVIGLGPGFEAGKDVHYVIETMRGHRLGSVIKNGSAEKNTGIPGNIGGYTKERVIYAEVEGKITPLKNIGEFVKKDEVIAKIAEKNIKASIEGILRGMIPENYFVKKGLKIADIDPRKSEYENCYLISDKAKAIGGGVLEAILDEIIKEKRKNGIKYFGENN